MKKSSNINCKAGSQINASSENNTVADKENVAAGKETRLFVGTYVEGAAEASRKLGIGLEINDFCYSANLDPDKRDETLEYIRDNFGENPASCDKTDGAEGLASCENLDGTEGSASCENLGGEWVLHGPFTEIIPSSIDHRAVSFGLERLEEAYEVCQILGIKRMIVHSGYMPLLYFKDWHHDRSVEFWQRFMADKPADFQLLIENVFEDEPNMLAKMIDQLGDERIKLCMDVGHANVYKAEDYPVYRWIEVLGSRIGHFHLHNNDGTKDSHSDLDNGELDFQRIVSLGREFCPEATYTLETKTAESSAKMVLQLLNQS